MIQTLCSEWLNNEEKTAADMGDACTKIQGKYIQSYAISGA